MLKDIKSAYRVVVKGLVRDSSGKLLFVQERSDSWDLPGGGLEHGEDVTEALKREFLEELEADVEVAAENPLIIPTWNTKFVKQMKFQTLTISIFMKSNKKNWILR